MWRDVVCDVCGLRYRDFRAESQPTFKEAYDIMIERARKLAAQGDYSKPARRHAVLGFMHEWKRQAWAEHVAECEHYAGLEVAA